MALLHFREDQNKTGYAKISDPDHKSVKVTRSSNSQFPVPCWVAGSCARRYIRPKPNSRPLTPEIERNNNVDVFYISIK
jgi:hypothetical protein